MLLHGSDFCLVAALGIPLPNFQTHVECGSWSLSLCIIIVGEAETFG
jgi:hypothetical protein